MSSSPLSDDKLREFLKGAIEDGDYTESFHSEHDHPDRDVSVDDVLHGLQQKWEHFQEPDFNQEHGNWKYYIKTTDIEGEVLHIIIAVCLKNRRFKVITRW